MAHSHDILEEEGERKKEMTIEIEVSFNIL